MHEYTSIAHSFERDSNDVLKSNSRVITCGRSLAAIASENVLTNSTKPYSVLFFFRHNKPNAIYEIFG